MLSFVLGFAGPPAAAVGLLLARKQNTNVLTPYAGPYALGFAMALFCTYIVPLRHCPYNPFLSQVIQRREAAVKRYAVEAGDVDDDYGLEHLWFNADLTPKTSWVNQGYWENARTASQACADLFQKILDVSGISKEKHFSIIELGSACAETSQYLMRNYADTCANWTGLTLSSLQAHVASERLATARETMKSPDGRARFQSFHADASQPGSWSGELVERLRGVAHPWIVAVDVLLHFEPSRKSTIAYFKKELNASFAVSDMIRKDDLTWLQRLKLRFSLGLLDTPLKNILTKKEYIDMLVDCGYDESKIEFVTFSEHVHKYYGKFVAEQGQRWQDLGGGKWDYNDFWLVGAVMKFWSEEPLIDSCIIVARA